MAGKSRQPRMAEDLGGIECLEVCEASEVGGLGGAARPGGWAPGRMPNLDDSGPQDDLRSSRFAASTREPERRGGAAAHPSRILMTSALPTTATHQDSPPKPRPQ